MSFYGRVVHDLHLYVTCVRSIKIVSGVVYCHVCDFIDLVVLVSGVYCQVCDFTNQIILVYELYCQV